MSNRPAPEHGKPDRTKDIWVELRTAGERIEGVVRVPKDARTRRISDILKLADRDQCGILHLLNVTVFDARSNAVRFHKRSMGINRDSVTFASRLEAPNESKMPWSLPPAEVLNN